MNSVLHICLLTSARVFDIAYGGEGRFTTSLGKWLWSHNIEVTLLGSGFLSTKAKHFLRSSDPAYKVNPARGKTVRTLNPPYVVYALSRMVMSLLWVLKIISINLRYPITIIHAQDTGYAGLAAVISGKILRIPVIVSSHGIRHRSLENIIHGKLKKFFLKMEYNLDLFTIKNATRILVDNSAIKDYFQKITFKENIDFIPIPIKVENYQFSQQNRDIMREEFGIDKQSIVIGFVGRFSPEKNLNTLLISFSNLVKQDPSITLILVGTGPLYLQLEAQVNNTGIKENVIFTGVRYDIANILSSLDIFVLPSYTEGLSTSLLEAMSCGCAVICSNIPGNRELVTHDIEGLLFDPNKPDELKTSMLLLCRDDQLRSRLIAKARIRTQQFDEDVIFSRILQYYERLYKHE